MAEVAIVIPTYNNLPELRNCLAALSQQTYRDFVAYVCVDGSTDDTLAYLGLEEWKPIVSLLLAKFFPEKSREETSPWPFPVRTLVHPDGRNHGRNAARNLALPYLDAHTWVAFLDSDSLPLPNWLESFLAAEPKPDEVLLGSILYFSLENPNPWQRYLAWRERHRARAFRRPPLSQGQFRYFVTGNAFMSTQLFLEANGMDSQIRRYGLGDVELGYRLQAMGCSFRYVPQAKVWSTTQQTPYKALSRLYQTGLYNLPYLHQKHPKSRLILFGGRWLIDRWRKQLLRLFLRPSWAKRILAYLSRLPDPLQRWAMRYLVFYAVARGFWKEPFALFPPQGERPA